MEDWRILKSWNEATHQIQDKACDNDTALHPSLPQENLHVQYLSVPV